MKTLKQKVLTVGGIWAFDIVCLILFIPVLHWI